MLQDMLISLRFILGTLAACSVLYPALLLALGQLVVSERAQGSLLRSASGEVAGSRLIAQAFERPEYLWPRPSAVGHDAMAGGGSNLAPSNPALAMRAAADVAQLAQAAMRPVPGDLVAASGSGLDPHITLAGALYQAERVARARGIGTHRVEEVVRHHASVPTPWSPPLVNVLETNLALDRDLGAVEDRSDGIDRVDR